MLTEQVLTCRKVKYGMEAWKAAIRARRVKTNFKTEPQAMIWRENPIYVVSHNNYSNAFYLPHPFLWRRTKKFTSVITILSSPGLDFVSMHRGKGALREVNAEITEQQSDCQSQLSGCKSWWAKANALDINSAKD